MPPDSRAQARPRSAAEPASRTRWRCEAPQVSTTSACRLTAPGKPTLTSPCFCAAGGCISFHPARDRARGHQHLATSDRPTEQACGSVGISSGRAAPRLGGEIVVSPSNVPSGNPPIRRRGSGSPAETSLSRRGECALGLGGQPGRAVRPGEASLCGLPPLASNRTLRFPHASCSRASKATSRGATAREPQFDSKGYGARARVSCQPRRCDTGWGTGEGFDRSGSPQECEQ